MTKADSEKAIKLLAEIGYTHPERWQNGRDYGVTMNAPDQYGSTVHFHDAEQVDRYLERGRKDAD